MVAIVSLSLVLVLFQALIGIYSANEATCESVHSEESEIGKETLSCGCNVGRDSPLVSDSVEADKMKPIVKTNTLESLTSLTDPADYIEDMVYIPGGTFFMGTDSPVIPYDGEGPKRPVQLSSFYIDRAEVSNEEFALFVKKTGFTTESESFGWSFVFESAVPPRIKRKITQAVLGTEWWLPVNGSYWREPEGPGTDVFRTKRHKHPVVQVSWNDAYAYCKWRNARLLTEAEFEYASRGNSTGTVFPWGNKLVPGVHRANVFQGVFPIENTAEDGYEFLCPSDAFPPQNSFGLLNIVGNAWEWVDDWFGNVHSKELQINPKGPDEGTDKVKKGGSFLCHKTYCHRYRLVSRYYSTPDSATLNTGFRCGRSANQ